VETVDANCIALTPSQPVRRRTRPTVRKIGEIRLPLAGPYRPRARLYLFPDGRLLWRVRLWEYDRAVVHLLRTEVLRAFARASGLERTLLEIDVAWQHGVEESRRALR
jgi:hypothetical protein